MSMRKTQDRALHYGRTKYKPGLGVCRCRVCKEATEQEWSLSATQKTRALGSPVEGCEYVNPEKAFADAWEEEQQRDRDMPLVQRLTVVYPKNGPRGFLGLDGGRIAFWLTPRERVIVASIVQWLGTNIGWCFLSEALKRCGYVIARSDMQAEQQKLLTLTREETRGVRSAFDSLLKERDTLVVRLAEVLGVNAGSPDDIVQAAEAVVERRDTAEELIARLNLNPQPVGSTAALARFVGLDEGD